MDVRQLILIEEIVWSNSEHSLAVALKYGSLEPEAEVAMAFKLIADGAKEEPLGEALQTFFMNYGTNILDGTVGFVNVTRDRAWPSAIPASGAKTSLQLSKVGMKVLELMRDTWLNDASAWREFKERVQARYSSLDAVEAAMGAVERKL